MMNSIRPGSMFVNRGLSYQSRSDAPHRSATKPILPTGWNNFAWSANIESSKPDGKLGPAKQMWPTDCWFMASLAAVANDKDGQKILAERITKTWSGYRVSFAGFPNNEVLISHKELQSCLQTFGGDADTRIIELAAEKFFAEKGRYKSLFIAAVMKSGMNESEANQQFQESCRINKVKNPLNYNPMRSGSIPSIAIFLLLGVLPNELKGSFSMPGSHIIKFLEKHVTNDQDGSSVLINGRKPQLGDSPYSSPLVILWDVIRTEITADAKVDSKELVFLNALNKYLERPDDKTRAALLSAAKSRKIQNLDYEIFVQMLDINLTYMNVNHRNLLRHAVNDVLSGGTGYIGFPGKHSGTILGINEAAQTFTYSEPNFPTMVHTADLIELIDGIRFGLVYLTAVEPTIEPHDRELMEQRLWDPPLNSPYLKRSPLQELRLAIATLNVKSIRDMADFAEFLDGKGKEGNDRFGLYGVWQISILDLHSSLWDRFNILPQYRQMIKDMAGRIFDTKYKTLLSEVHGGDGIFEPGDLKNWLSKHQRNGDEPDSTAFHTFYASIQELNEKAAGIMDWLEWHDDPGKADPGNGRFGMRGVQMLSRLTPASRQWEASGSGHLDHASRQSLIEKAKVLIDPDYAFWTFQVHQGDMIFERDDMNHWLADNRM